MAATLDISHSARFELSPHRPRAATRNALVLSVGVSSPSPDGSDVAIELRGPTWLRDRFGCVNQAVRRGLVDANVPVPVGGFHVQINLKPRPAVRSPLHDSAATLIADFVELSVASALREIHKKQGSGSSRRD